MLGRVYTRDDPRASTQFSLTRFLVPHLAGYSGAALFVDCDMIFRADVYELFAELDHTCSVMVAKHEYTPKTGTKFMGATQHSYPRKNWSSVMLFNCGHKHTHRLTPEYVNSVPPSDLHRFAWTDDDRIGALPLEWNWLVGEYEPNEDAKLLHYTLGTPCFEDYAECEMAEYFHEEQRLVNSCGG